MNWSEIIETYWLGIESVDVITCLIITELVKAPIKKYSRDLVVLIPVFISGLVVFFLSPNIKFELSTIDNFKTWGGETMILTGATVFVFKFVYSPAIKKYKEVYPAKKDVE